MKFKIDDCNYMFCNCGHFPHAIKVTEDEELVYFEFMRQPLSLFQKVKAIRDIIFHNRVTTDEVVLNKETWTALGEHLASKALRVEDDD